MKIHPGARRPMLKFAIDYYIDYFQTRVPAGRLGPLTVYTFSRRELSDRATRLRPIAKAKDLRLLPKKSLIPSRRYPSRRC